METDDLARAALRSQRDAPKSMRRMDHMKEQRVQHCGFLLWAAQDPTRRSMAAITRLVDRSHSTVRQWRDRYRWKARVRECKRPELWAAKLLLRLYPGYVVPALNALDSAYDLAQLTADPDISPKERADKALEKVNAGMRVADNALEKDLDTMQLILRGVLNKALENVKDDRIDVKISELPGIIRTWMLVSGGGAAAGKENKEEHRAPAVSVRVQEARTTGGTPLAVLGAMREDLEEAQAIVSAMISHEEGAAIMNFPGYEHAETTPEEFEVG